MLGKSAPHPEYRMPGIQKTFIGVIFFGAVLGVQKRHKLIYGYIIQLLTWQHTQFRPLCLSHQIIKTNGALATPANKSTDAFLPNFASNKQSLCGVCVNRWLWYIIECMKFAHFTLTKQRSTQIGLWRGKSKMKTGSWFDLLCGFCLNRILLVVWSWWQMVELERATAIVPPVSAYVAWPSMIIQYMGDGWCLLRLCVYVFGMELGAVDARALIQSDLSKCHVVVSIERQANLG